MAIIRWDPFREFAQLQGRINRAFSDAYGHSGDDALLSSGAWLPPVDIHQNGDHELVLTAELPGMVRENIEITVDHGTLAIKGEKKMTSDVKEDDFHRVERRYGSFSRTFSLPSTVDTSKVAADYKDGVLTVRVPLREEAKPRQIKLSDAAA